MTIDPRLIERRKVVAEDRARRNVRRLLRFLLVLVVLGAGVWLLLSPWLSVSEVRTAGVGKSKTHGILADAGVLAGTPMVFVRSAVVESLLEEDPWVAEARIHLEWPDTVIVRVEERTPVAWVETSGGWTRRALDGEAVPSGDIPDETLAWVRVPDVAESAAADTATVLGAVEFVANLPEDLQAGTIITVADNDELWAQVGEYRARLGRPVEMAPKALSLVAVLRENPDSNSVITLIAPTHPAVSPILPATPDDTTPGADVEVEVGETTQP